MGFAQWFWRLFLVFAGLIVAHVLCVTWLVISTDRATAERHGEIWLSAAVTIAVGAAAIWYSARRIIQPLAALSRQVRSRPDGNASGGLLSPADEVGVLTGAFDQMQRDLAHRRDQIQDHSERLQPC